MLALEVVARYEVSPGAPRPAIEITVAFCVAAPCLDDRRGQGLGQWVERHHELAMLPTLEGQGVRDRLVPQATHHDPSFAHGHRVEAKRAGLRRPRPELGTRDEYVSQRDRLTLRVLDRTRQRDRVALRERGRRKRQHRRERRDEKTEGAKAGTAHW